MAVIDIKHDAPVCWRGDVRGWEVRQPPTADPRGVCRGVLKSLRRAACDRVLSRALALECATRTPAAADAPDRKDRDIPSDIPERGVEHLRGDHVRSSVGLRTAPRR